MNSEPLCIDICCGCGGLSFGFQLAGFRPVLGMDIDSHALATFARNIKGAKVICTDIRQFSGEGIYSQLPALQGRIEGVLAAPPCQGFSQSNRRYRVLTNPMNLLYIDVMRLIENVRPKWFLIENVWGLEHVGNGHVKNHVVSLAHSMGYLTKVAVINAADYGVPQLRRRIFFIGILGQNEFHFPRPMVGRHPTVRDAIADLPLLGNGDCRDVLPYRLWGAALSQYQVQMRGHRRRGRVTSNLVTRNNGSVLARYQHIPPGGNWQNIPANLLRNYKNPSNCHTGIYRRLRWDGPSIVISNFRKNMLIHPEEDRGLSVREAARLQSFPDHFVFAGSIGFQQQQVADAVPPLLAYALAMQLRDCLY